MFKWQDLMNPSNKISSQFQLGHIKTTNSYNHVIQDRLSNFQLLSNMLLLSCGTQLSTTITTNSSNSINLSHNEVVPKSICMFCYITVQDIMLNEGFQNLKTLTVTKISSILASLHMWLLPYQFSEPGRETTAHRLKFTIAPNGPRKV